MAFERSEDEPNSTPKLSLSKLPSKLREPSLMATPPLNRLASIPFQWEEAPGKPRATVITTITTTNTSPASDNKTSAARCLDLPPRLLNNTAKVTNVSSPITVLDGPYNSPFLSSLFSLPKGSFRSLEEELVRGERSEERDDHQNMSKESRRLKGPSWKWGSFKEIRRVASDSRNFSTCSSGSSKGRHRSAAKLSRIKRRSSFFNFSHAGSNLLSGVYGSLKQVVSWRRSQD